MRARASQIFCLAIGVVLLAAFSRQNVQGQSLLQNQPASGLETLTGNWSMAQNNAGSLTYYYSVNHSNDGDDTAPPPEIIYAVALDSGAAAPGLSSTQGEPGSFVDQAPDFQQSSWTPIDFQDERARLVTEIELDLRSVLGRPEVQDYVADDRFTAVPHVSLSAYMDSAVPEPPSANLFAIAALALLPFVKTNVLRHRYCRPWFLVSAMARRH